MMMNGIIIRKARMSEAQQIAQLLMLAWPVEDIMESNGISYAQLHESMTDIASMEETVYSYENTYVAEVDGKIVGAMCGYDGADYQRFKQPIVDLLGNDSVFAHLQETEAGEFYLDSVGVLPEYRGNGIASMLFEAQIERAVLLGHKVVGLIVDEDKPQAEALYTRLGFRYVDDKDFFGHKMKHMVKPIEITGKYYRHFKGNIYKVLHIAKHSETLEDIVVYQAMYGNGDVWVRPRVMFEEVIERDGKRIKRFSPISAEEVESIINKE